MSDISLDLNKSSSTYKDFQLIDNDLALTSDAQAGGSNPVQQDILQALSMFLGEWFMDNTKGVPWMQQILVKNPDQSKIDALLLNTILGRPGVNGVSYYLFKPNLAARTLYVEFNAQSTSGPINYSGTLGG